MPSNIPWGDTSITNSPISGFAVLDVNNNPITGPFSQTVTVSSNSSAVTLAVLGGSSGSSVQLTSGSAQILTWSYSGAATDPVTITASATGATTKTIVFTPVAQPIVYTPPASLPSTCLDLCLYAPLGGGAGSTYTFTATQAGYTGAFGNNITITGASGCSNFATISPLSGTSFTVTATAAPIPGTCMITLNGFATTLTETITYSSAGVTLQ